MDDNIDRRSHWKNYNSIPMGLIEIVAQAVREGVREGITEGVVSKGGKGGKVVYFIKGGESSEDSESSEKVRERC